MSESNFQNNVVPKIALDKETESGPKELSGKVPVWSPPIWNEIINQADGKDLKSLALLDLRNQISNAINNLNEEGQNFRENLVRYKNDLRKVEKILIGITFVAVIAFIIGFYQITSDNIKQKDLYLKYDNLYQSYSNKNEKLKEEINKQNVEIIDLRNQIDLLKAKNSYLK